MLKVFFCSYYKTTFFSPVIYYDDRRYAIITNERDYLRRSAWTLGLAKCDHVIMILLLTHNLYYTIFRCSYLMVLCWASSTFEFIWQARGEHTWIGYNLETQCEWNFSYTKWVFFLIYKHVCFFVTWVCYCICLAICTRVIAINVEFYYECVYCVWYIVSFDWQHHEILP